MRFPVVATPCGQVHGAVLARGLTGLFAALLVLAFAGCSRQPGAGPRLTEDEFIRLMNLGKNHFEKGEAPPAIAAFTQAAQIDATRPDVHLNLANAHLLANQPEAALKDTQAALERDASSAAAFFLSGCARLRLRQFDDAIKDLQRAKDIDQTVNAVSYQLARAHQELGHYPEARSEFDELLSFEPEHPAANYNLSQVLLRLGKADEAKQALERHQQVLAKREGKPADATTFERCVHTQIRAPFKLDQPYAAGVTVTFADATAGAFAGNAANYHGPLGVLDINHRGLNDLFVREGTDGFRLLKNNGGTFAPQGPKLNSLAGNDYSACVVGDLNNDRFEDVIVLGTKGAQVFKLATNGTITEITGGTGLKGITGTVAALVDLDFTGKLDLLAVAAVTNDLRLYRNLGNAYYKHATATSGIPAQATSVRQLAVADWNNDELLDVIVGRDGQPPLLLVKQRGGPLVPTNPPTAWPAGGLVAAADLNNDLRNDLVVATADGLEIVYGAGTNRVRLPAADSPLSHLVAVDYDNDGWLDLLAAGRGLHLWRNLGRAGFRNVTAPTGLDRLVTTSTDALVAADFDNDGDIDVAVSTAGAGAAAGLHLLRNDGGNANQLLKLRLVGNRSNASGLGIRLELTAGGLRLMRTINTLPVEIGVGPHSQLDSLTVHWFELSPPFLDVTVEPKTPLPMVELVLPTGSCPYLYAWDGSRFRFVTDILGAAPLGLPVAEGVYIESDPDEYVRVGDAATFPPRGDGYVLQVTEELREVLYLDHAKLVVVDHPPGTEVHPTSKLLPRKPYPQPGLMVVQHRHPLRRAVTHADTDVTRLLSDLDGQRVSPTRLRAPQLRGLAEPHSVTLDFGPLHESQPLVLVLSGWLRFGGGMANIAASHDPTLPFPFPTLEVETAEGKWQPVDVAVGAPCGKSKTIVVDLTGRLPAASRRLRLATAFEIHWDRIALFERAEPALAHVRELLPTRTDLHWRGFSDFADLPWTEPLTPNYDRVTSRALWRITPAGFCTRYGPVDPLLARRDNALVLLNGGDELTLTFAADQVPPCPADQQRDFFFFSTGWDKDSDFHVAHGTTVEPLPFHGMNDQRYGQEAAPAGAATRWTDEYNTRYVGPTMLSRTAPSAKPTTAR